MRLFLLHVLLCLCMAVPPNVAADNGQEQKTRKSATGQGKAEQNLMRRERQLELAKAAKAAKREKAAKEKERQKNSQKSGALAAPEEDSGGEAEPEIWQGEFEKGKATLYLWPDHFFALTLGGAHPRHITGIWRMNGDGVRMELFNSLDLSIGISRGKSRLYASLGDLGWGSGSLSRQANTPLPVFQATGKLEKDSFEDMASGRVFALGPDVTADGNGPLFATVEIRDGKVGRVINRSTRFPRIYASAALAGEPGRHRAEMASFSKNVLGHYWLLPPMRGVEKAALLFVPKKEVAANARNENDKKSEKIDGYIEISGPGLRGEGTFAVDGENVKISLDRESGINLAAIGAGDLASAIDGQFVWRATGGMLSLTGNGRTMRFVAH